MDLFEACKSGDYELVKKFIDEGADVNAINYDYSVELDCSDYGCSPLIVASKNGHKEICELLIASGANVNLTYEYGTALIVASEEDHYDICKLLIENGADVNAEIPDSDYSYDDANKTALFRACEKGYKNICELMIANGADVNIKTTDGSTALINAIYISRNILFSLYQMQMMAVKFKIYNVLHSYAESDIYKILFKTYYEICELLIKNGADVNASIWGGEKSALMFAYLDPDSDEYEETFEKKNKYSKKLNQYSKKLCKLLLDNGANVNHIGDYGRNILEMAIYNKDIEFCKLLIQKGANVNLKDNFNRGKKCLYGHKILEAAIKMKDKEINKLLYENGIKFEFGEEDLSSSKKEYDDYIKARNVNRCHLIKEDLMAYVWNPDREFTKWALMDEFSEELKPTGGAGI